MYPLYYTLCSNLPTCAPGEKEKKRILKKIKKANSEEKTAFFYLIIEHARKEENYVYKKKLPYKGKNDEKGVEFPLDKLPDALIWILYRFSKLNTTK